jgi:hypothetical protein
MRHFKRIFPILLFFLVTAFTAVGQVASSPFSKFGIGDLTGTGIAQNQGMGGIGISNPSGAYLNNQNPALLVFNRLMVFHGGLQYEKIRESDGTNSQSFSSGNMNYLAIGLPVKSGKLTTSFGLMPYSHVNYKLSFADYATGSTVPITRLESGSGGINQFYWSNGYAINRYLSVGAKAAYLFGSIVTQESNLFTSSLVSTYSSVYVRDYFHGFNFTGGISFHKDTLFHKNYRLNIGFVYTPGTTLHNEHYVRYELKSSAGPTIDSATVVKNAPGKTNIPQNFGVGLSFGKIDKWTFGGDFTYLDFTSFNGFTNSIGIPTVGYRSGIGFEFTPDIYDFTNYLSRITYRIGGAYQRMPYLVNGNPLRDVAGTAGFSFPVGRASTVDLGIRIGKRGVLPQSTVEENYFRVYFGITFNDQWFIKRKFD